MVEREDDEVEQMLETLIEQNSRIVACLSTREFWIALGIGLGWDNTGAIPEFEMRWHQYVSFMSNNAGLGQVEVFFKELAEEFNY